MLLWHFNLGRLTARHPLLSQALPQKPLALPLELKAPTAAGTCYKLSGAARSLWEKPNLTLGLGAPELH